jgi:histidinol-phosphate/aromatic aminotransferase/cobyric acid decarboxylase-like protein
VKRAKDDGRLLVVRTMSKAFGLAGLRIGYAVGSPDLVRQVEKTRGPYKVSALAEAAAVAALDHDREWVQKGIDDVLVAKERFVAFLRGRGHQPFPSSSNFVLVRVADAAATTAKLRERGVAVRPFPALPGIGEAVRVSVAAWPKMEKFLPAFEEVFPCV